MKRLVGAAVTLALTGVLVGCATEGGRLTPQPTTGTDPSVPSSAAPSGQPAAKGKLTIWAPGSLNPTVKEYAQTFPGADVTILEIPEPASTNLYTKLSAGEHADLIYWHGIGNWLAQMNPDKNLADISDLPFVENTRPGILESSTTWNGKIVGAIVDYPAIDGVLYNQKTVERLGLELPHNYQELLAFCDASRAADPNVIPLAMGGADKWPLQVVAANMFNDGIKADPELIDRLNRNETTFSDPAFMVGFEALKELHERGCFNKDIATDGFGESLRQLVSGEAAILPGALSVFVNNIRDGYGTTGLADIHFLPLSYTTDVSSWQTVNEAIYVTKNDADPAQLQLAKDFVTWITGDGYQGYIDATIQYPVINTAQAPEEDFPTILVEANEAFERDTVPQFQQRLQADYGDFPTFLSELLFNNQTPQWVAEQMQAEFERSAKLIGLPGF